ncbi:MAG: hypothetical protein DME02_06800 [Candidatus Rokuibacteriota bacterium]|jgi:hypothetical protein|nr:MAG: hypothetical protein DME02_06800 [Candidatus Rokubacteria bacterium]PYO23877.1 MAG: hypothetical protein DMD85_08295 [Candidatus Rokubacteria bacterium]
MSELTRRYVVMSLATAAPFDVDDHDGVFVLKPWKDPAALRALTAYRDNCYPELARDLDAWIRAIQQGPAVRGDVGRRNEPHVRRRDGGHGGQRRAKPRAPGPKSSGPESRASRTAHPRSKPGSRHPRRQKRRRRRR